MGYNHRLEIWISEVSNHGFRVNGKFTAGSNSYNGFGFNAYTSVDGLGRRNHSIKIPSRGGNATFSDYYEVGTSKDDRWYNCHVGADSSWSSNPVETGNPVNQGVTVPKVPLDKHGNPSFNVNSTNPLQDENLTFTWSKAGHQGGARFDRFELWHGSTRIYSGGGGRASFRADSYGLGAQTFRLKEIHEWYGSYPETWVDITVQVMDKQGAPSISINRDGALQNQNVTISWNKSSDGSNARLEQYELWRGGTRIYNGGGLSLSDNPTVAVGVNGGDVTYTVKEIHEWYGRRYTTQSSKVVHVVAAQKAPQLVASKTTCNYGETIKLNFKSINGSGTGNFDRYELWQGNTKIYGGKAASYDVVPSTYSGARGGKVQFKLYEYHEWWGQYPRTETTITITVRSGVVSIYDSNSKRHTGLVTAYDGAGKPHFVLITGYDSAGKAHSVV